HADAAQPGTLTFRADEKEPIILLAIRVGAPTGRPGGLFHQDGITTLRASAALPSGGSAGTALHLDAVTSAGSASAPIRLRVDIYSRGQCALTHYGYWALPLYDGAADLAFDLDPGAKQANFRDGGGRVVPSDQQTWPSGDGLYRGVLFVRDGERTDIVPAFQ